MTDGVAGARLETPWARTAGLLYVGTIVTGVFFAYFVGQLTVRGDAAATARNLIDHGSLFRVGILAQLAGTMFYIAVTAILYHMLAPVSRQLSLLATLFSVVGCAVGVFVAISDLAALLCLGGAPYLAPFSSEQLQALAYTFERLAGQANTVGLLCFAVYCVLIGLLIMRATFIPRFVGVIMALAGLCWIVSNGATILSPPLGAMLAPLTFAGIAGEAVLTVWLLVMGIDVAKWRSQAASAG